MTENYWTRNLRYRHSRRRFLGTAGVAGAGAASLALVGCGDDDDAPSPTSGATSAPGSSPTPAEQPKQGGTFRYPIFGLSSGDPPTLYPYENITYQTQTTASYHYSRLLRGKVGPGIGPTDFTELEGDLAQGLPELPDDTTYVFKWKPNIKFHDKAPMNGRAATVHDFVQTWEYFSASAINASRFNQVIDKLEATDDETITITLKEPNAPFLVVGAASDQGVYFIPTETINNDQVKTDPVGTGPWVFNSYETGVRMTWDRNPSWYDGPAPYFEALEATLQRDAQRIVSSLESGDLDYSSLSAAQAPDVASKLDPAGLTTQTLAGGIQAAWFNFDNKPWDDPRVRRALSMAIDRQGVLDALDPSGNTNWNSFFGPALSPFYLNPAEPDVFGTGAENFQYDPAAARALLQEAGHEGLDVEIISNVDRYGQSAQQQWEAVRGLVNEAGFNAQNVYQEYGAYIQSSYYAKYPGSGKEITLGPIIGTVLDPDDLLLACYWSQSSRHNWGGAPLKEQADLDILYLKQRTQLDIEDRSETLQEIQRKMAEIMFVVPVVTGSGLTYAQPYVKNFHPRTTYAITADTYPWAYFTDERIAKG